MAGLQDCGVFYHPSVCRLRTRVSAIRAIPAAAEGIEMGNQQTSAIVNPHLAGGELVGYYRKTVVLWFVGCDGIGSPHDGAVAVHHAPHTVDTTSHSACNHKNAEGVPVGREQEMADARCVDKDKVFILMLPVDDKPLTRVAFGAVAEPYGRVVEVDCGGGYLHRGSEIVVEVEEQVQYRVASIDVKVIDMRTVGRIVVGVAVNPVVGYTVAHHGAVVSAVGWVDS